MGIEMYNAMAIETDTFVSAQSAPRMQQMPLTFLRGGDNAYVVKVRGRGDVHHHLENLGFVEGAQVRVACEQSGGVIVDVKGARVALDKSAASKIIVCA